MTKVGIITIVRVNNYGAELQAYATQAALQKAGYDAEIIDYLFYKNKGHKTTRLSRPVFPMSFKKRLAEWLYPKREKLKAFVQRNKLTIVREDRFACFHNDNTRFSSTYHSYDELLKADMDYDAYIVGSDQVWNPGVYSSLEPYFLMFAPSSKRKLSYASSIGLNELPDYTHSYYHQALNGLDAISVREEKAVDLVKQVSGRDAQWVLDPTLLLNTKEWLEVAKKPEGLPEKYVLLYELTPCPYLKTLAKHIAEIKGYKVVRITKDANRVEPDEDVVNVMNAGPAEFLGMFGGTEFVVTNSFHGTAFSINMNKPFYVVTPAHKNNNSRQQSILKLFGLSSRIIAEGADFPSESDLAINFDPVNNRLSEERQKSMNYLKTAIDGGK
ncbi:MAG: polysaccharide pyruvyl transferase family protein [Bacteroides sp.]|nr:polysaccharide pyruvyl transferase family protein [Bacteroides sp.]MCM1447172.1 polysaccharide pyruvyl transferase family protein [Bacteroides sp.]